MATLCDIRTAEPKNDQAENGTKGEKKIKRENKEENDRGRGEGGTVTSGFARFILLATQHELVLLLKHNFVGWRHAYWR
jgi:hypothetical protein